MNTTYQTPNLDTSWERLKEIVQEQAELIRSLQTQTIQKKCECHIIDPSKMRVLLWINRHKDGKPDTCVLKIAEQRLLGLPRSDRRGETYWRFDEIIEVKKEEELIKCYQCQKEVKKTKIPCWECQAEIKIIGELDESAPLICSDCEKKKAEKPLAKEETQNPQPKSKRQELKEQIAQAIKENKPAEQHQK